MRADEDALSWHCGYNDGLAGRPSRAIKVPDELAYASGFIEGREARAIRLKARRPELRVVSGGKAQS